MARKYGTATLTLTVTEAITLNSKDEGQSHSHTISNIADIYRRTMTATTSTDTTIATFSSLFGVGQFVAADMRYLRITNLDDTNGVAVILEDTGADTAAILVDPDSTLMLTDTQIEAFTDGSAFSGWSDIDQIFLKAASANTQVEVVIATTE